MADSGAPQLVCVYRHRNADRVLSLAEAVEKLGGAAYLWALDVVDHRLATRTSGSGPGERLVLLNRLIGHTQPTGSLIVCDDDISFATGSLARLLRIVGRARLDLAQPAHARGSLASHSVTRRMRSCVARQTRFVEVGPLVVIAERIRPLITPFPEEYGMGWGLDIVWSDLALQGYRLGVVDRATVRHHGEVGAEYDSTDGERAIARELALRGYEDMHALNQTLAFWRAYGPLDPRNAVPLWRRDRLST